MFLMLQEKKMAAVHFATIPCELDKGRVILYLDNTFPCDTEQILYVLGYLKFTELLGLF